MRHPAAAVGALLLLTSTLAACGGSSASDEPAPARSTAGASSAAASSSVPPSTSRSTSRSTSAWPSPNVLPSRAVSSTPRKGAPPAGRVAPGSPVSGDGYVRPGTTADFQFSTAGGKWQCVITATEAGCVGDLPATARPPAHADSVQVGLTGAATYASGGAAKFGSRDAKKKPAAGKNLPAGRSITNGEFVCAALPRDGIQCETTSSSAGFRMQPTKSWLW